MVFPPITTLLSFPSKLPNDISVNRSSPWRDPTPNWPKELSPITVNFLLFVIKAAYPSPTDTSLEMHSTSFSKEIKLLILNLSPSNKYDEPLYSIT